MESPEIISRPYLYLAISMQITFPYSTVGPANNNYFFHRTPLLDHLASMKK